MKKILGVLSMFVLLVSLAAAQDNSGELAAVLEVLEGNVEIQRANTVNRVAISVEAVVGVGDTIFTGDASRARITYFEDGVSAEILPNTEYRIDGFTGDVSGDTFTIEVSVLLGQTQQQLQRLLNANSSYQINTPGMTLAARGTIFDVRVKDDGQAAMLVSEGTVAAVAGSANADVPVGYGVRSLVGDASGLSDVVRATTFAELDAALDGCTVTITTADDVSLNVRTGPAITNDLSGYALADDIALALGTNEGGDWYRIVLDDGFGWVLASNATVNEGCAGLRVFPDIYVEGDVLTPTAADETSPSREEDTTSDDDV